MSNLWVDDEREPPLDWMWAKTSEGAIEILGHLRIEHLSLDYVIVGGENTDAVMYWLKEHPDRWPTGSIVGHSGSTDGVKLIEHLVKEYAPKGWTNG